MTIQDWIDALLSDKYKQTQSRLRDSLGHCCLGVACDVKNPDIWEEASIKFPDRIAYQWGKGTEEENPPTHYLPKDLMAELDIDDHFQQHLTYLNDNGSTFAEIAEVIKKYAEGKYEWPYSV